MTRNEIKQRLDELKEELDNLADEMAQIEAEEAERAEIKPWRAGHTLPYWIINDCNEVIVCSDWADPNDDNHYYSGNYYRTYELAEQDAKELALRGRVRQLRDALCEGYQFVPGGENYCIMYNSCAGKFCIECTETVTAIAEILFDTKEHALMACDILNEESKND